MKLMSKIDRRFFPVLAGFMTASTIVAATWLFSVSEHRRQAQEERLQALQQMSTVRARLEGTLNSRLLLVKSIVSYISIHCDIDHETFQSFAEGLVAGDHMIRNVTLLKDTVIVDVYPVKGEKKVIGLDLAKVSGQRETLKRAIETRQVVIAGPLDLVQGGIGIVSRIPIFLTPEGKPLGSGAYWGQASVVIQQDLLFKEVGILDGSTGLRFALRGKDGLGARGVIFWGDERVFQSSPVIMDVALPGGTWQMAAMPAAGWGSISPPLSSTYVAGSLLSLFAGWMVWALLLTKESLKHQLILQQSLMQTAKESETKYRTLFESAHDAMLIMKENKITDCNAASLGIFGCERTQLVGNHRFVFSPPRQPDGRDSKEKALEKMALALSGQPQFYEWIHCRYDGTPFEAEVSLNRLDVNGEIMLQAIVRDITDRKKAEARLLESERKYRELVEHANSIILRWTRDGKITFLNEFGQKFFGYSSEEILGRHVVGTIVPMTDSSGLNLGLLMDQILADPKAFEQNVNENMRRNGRTRCDSVDQ